MIVHVFIGSRYHLVPIISEGIITHYSQDADHYFVLYGKSDMDKQKYITLYNQYNFSNYVFCHSLLEFSKIIWKLRKKPVLFHSGSYSWFAIANFLRAKNLHWICWGAGSSINKKNIKSILMTPVKCWLYYKFQTIIVLMDDDKKTIVEDFHVCSKKVRVMSYASNEGKSPYNELILKLLMEEKEQNQKPLVLLGNSPRCFSSYFEMLPRLAQYKGKIRVQCMNHYSLIRDDAYNQLISLGKDLFGDDFRSNEEFYNVEDYLHYMNTCDIYICSVDRQSGLGAASNCLRLGKKVYVHGKNYNWLKDHLNCVIFDTDQITPSLSYEDFVSPLSKNDQIFNFNAIVQDKIDSAQMWHEFYKSIDVKEKCE